MTITDTLERFPDRLRPNRMANMLLYVIAAFVLVFVSWAALARVDEVSRASGRVIPSHQLQVVSNLEGGIVKEILVRQGMRVAAGQPLLRLDETQLASEFLQNREGYNALVARISRLSAEVSNTAPVFPEALMRAAPDLVAAERSLYAARQADLAASLSMAQAKLEQARQAQAQARADISAKAEAKQLAEREVALITPLVEKGIEPQISLLRARSTAVQTASELTGAQAAAARAAAAVSEALAEQRRARDEFRAQAVGDLTKAKGELAAMGRGLPALEDRVERTEVRAPIAGTINRVLVTTVGGIVRPGEPLVEIVPSDDALEVEARLAPKDVAFVRPGQRALVKITAYDFSIYGGLDGRVMHISPDAVVDEKTGESHYLIRVRTEQKLKAPNGAELPISAGMTADIDLLGDKRSILAYLLTPFTRLKDAAFREK